MTQRSIAPFPNTLATELERLRLQHRARRIRFVVSALRRLSDARPEDNPPPLPLRQALTDFSRELSELDRRLGGRP